MKARLADPALIVGTIVLLTAALPANPLNAAPGEEKWRTPIRLSAGPTLGLNGLVYGVTQGGDLHAWEAANGQLRWVTNVTAINIYSPLVVGPEGHIYVSTYTGLHALDGQTGRRLWSVDEGGAIVVGPDGTVFVLDYESLHALDPESGNIRWSYFGRLFGIPALSANGKIFITAAFGRVLALDAHTGRREWEFQERDISFLSVIVAGDGTVLASGAYGHLYALDGTTGRSLWHIEDEEYGAVDFASVVIAPDGAICIGTYNGHRVLILEPTTGTLRRELDLGFSLYGGLMLGTDDTLFAAEYGRLYSLNFTTGETNWMFETPGLGISGLNMGSDGTVYFVTFVVDDALYAIRSTNGLANSAWPKVFQSGQNNSYWTVSGPPQITKQPRSHWAALEASTDFHFYSPVMRPLSIQWRFNGQSIPGATNESLRIEHVAFSDTGGYSVAVSNQFGGTVSDEAVLSVGYALAVTTLGPGVVKRMPDLEVYPTNAVVEITAIPQTNRNFLRWSGDATGSVQTLMVVLERNNAITATFEYLPGDVKWRLPFDEVALSADGTIYGHTLYTYMAVDPATRRTIWEIESNGETYSPPVVGRDGTVYFTSYGETLNAIDGQTGEWKWGFSIGVCTDRAPVLGVDGTIYFGGRKLYAIDPVSGTEKWSVEGAGASLAVGANHILYASCETGLCAFNASTGEKIWEFPLLLEPPLPHPIVGLNDTVYFRSGGGQFHALNGNTGETRWESSVVGGGIVGPDGSLYGGSDERVWALDGQTGEEKWTYDDRGGAPVALTADGTLYVSSAGKLFALSSSSGDYLWETPGDDVINVGTINIGSDGTLYSSGHVLHGTSPLAAGGWPRFQGHMDNRGRIHSRPLLDGSQSQFTTAGFALTVHGEVNDVLGVEWTANWLNWTPLQTATNTTGTVRLLDTAPVSDQRFYRALIRAE